MARLRNDDEGFGEPLTPRRYSEDVPRKSWWVLLSPLGIPLLLLGGLWALGEHLLR